MNLIFLIGPPGSGKTSAGQELARLLECEFFDTDRLIELKSGKTVAEIFEEFGEPHFRSMELQLLDDIRSIPQPLASYAVFATGGGLPVYNNNLLKLQELGKVVALHADIQTLVSRLLGDRERPLLAGSDGNETLHLEKKLSELLDTRSPVYGLAGYKINTSGISALEVATQILHLIKGSADSSAS